MRNNPVLYTDPSGHLICLDGVQCYNGGAGSLTLGGSGGGGGGGSNDDYCDTHPWACGGEPPDEVDEILSGGAGGGTHEPNQEDGSGTTPYCNNYGLFNCAIELPNWNWPPIDLFFIRMRMVGQQTLIYGYNSDSPLTVGPGYVSLGGTEISYDGIEANLSGPSFAYIGANANIQVSTFSGSSMSTEPPFGMPMVSQHVGTSIEIITEALYFSEDIRIEFSGRPVETAVIPVLYYLYQSGLGPIFEPSLQP